MSFTKTRIWHGGIAEITRGEGLPPPPHHAQQVAEHCAGPTEATEMLPAEEPVPSRATEPRAPVDELLARWDQAAERLNAPKSVRDDDLETTPVALSITRLLPIEELFPQQGEEQAPALAPSRNEGWRSWLSAARERAESGRPARARARVMLLLAGALALAVVFTRPLWLGTDEHPAQAHASATPGQTRVTADAPSKQEARSSTEGAAGPVALQRTDRAVAARHAGPEGLERSAIDAVVSGDLVRALRLYQALVQAAPNHPVYREALRIISDQVARDDHDHLPGTGPQ